MDGITIQLPKIAGRILEQKIITMSTPQKCGGKIVYKGAYKEFDSKTLSFTILPKGTTLTKAKKAGKAFTVYWKKQTGKMAFARISGYQIRYSLKSNMSQSKTGNVNGYKYTSKKIKNLKAKKKYYIQIRTYMKVKGKTYYSGWSGKKSVVTGK